MIWGSGSLKENTHATDIMTTAYTSPTKKVVMNGAIWLQGIFRLDSNMLHFYFCGVHPVALNYYNFYKSAVNHNWNVFYLLQSHSPQHVSASMGHLQVDWGMFHLKMAHRGQNMLWWMNPTFIIIFMQVFLRFGNYLKGSSKVKRLR
jgi:hypothetical protein